MTGRSPEALTTRRQLLGLGVVLAFTYVAASIGGVATTGGLDPWYAELDKPSWTPPGSVFGPVWTLLYTLMAVAAWLVWRAGGAAARTAMVLYGVQLALNVGWSLVFFGAQAPTVALVDILALLVAVTLTIRAFARWSGLAAWLLAPYLLWVAFATALNAEIVRLNL